ncbi:MAG: tetratricopeptide repeat protein, partial [Candidatus Margulisiibacteriota bacterium]
MKKEQNYYYDAMEYLNAGNTKTAKKLLEKAIKLDPDYVEAYIGMTAMYREIGNFKKEKEYADLAFEKTRLKFPVWPEKII